MKITRWLRVIHRDLGFLIVGITLVYGISGILLNHLGGKDPAFKTEEGSLQFESGLNQDELKNAWEAHPALPALKRTAEVDENHTRLFLDGGIGIYNSADGHLDYEKHQKRVFVYWINRLHYSRARGWTPVADIFAIALIFLAVSGIFITKGKHGIKGYGKWYLIAGLLLPLLFVLLQ
jgi:hypothetical protein